MAIIRDGEKYACSTCIKGHRVAGCKHSDRDLILVRRRGRPSTQCEHCKRLRNGNRKVHTKCVCGSNATTTTTTDMEYDSSSNSSSNNNAINSTFYFTGVIANNTINTYNNSNGTSNGNSVRSNNIVPAIAPKSVVSRCKCGCSENCRCCSVILSVPALLNPCDCREHGTECVNCRTVVPLTFEQAAAEGHIDPNCRCGNDNFGKSCCSGEDNSNDITTSTLLPDKSAMLDSLNTATMIISNNMTATSMSNTKPTGCCSSKSSSTVVDSKPANDTGCCSKKQQPIEEALLSTLIGNKSTTSDNNTECNGCGPTGCACSNDTDTGTNEVNYHDSIVIPVELEQHHSSTSSNGSMSDHGHYSSNSSESSVENMASSLVISNDHDDLSEQPSAKRRRSNDIGGEELMRTVYNKVVALPTKSQCGCSSGGGCGPGCGTSCKGCCMPGSSNKSTSTTGAGGGASADNDTSNGGGCCSPNNGCASTVGNPRRAPYKNKQGELTCSCGCEKASQDCTDCFEDLCEEFLLNPPV